MSIIDDAIAKYSSGDEAYALKLKKGIRESMGYSNYMSRIGEEASAPAEAPVSMKGKNLTPQAIAAGQQAGFNIQNRNINSLERIAGAMDTAAGSLASEQVSREKKARENPTIFESKDWLDDEMKKFMLDRPKNDDGTEKTVDQFREELLGKSGDTYGAKWQSPDTDKFKADIDARINQRIPKDIGEKRAYYQALAAGETKAVADDIQDRDDYVNNKMTSGQKVVYELLNPNVKDNLVDPNDVATIKDDQGGVSPKLPFEELKKKYPKADEGILKKPYRDSLVDDANMWYKENKAGVDELLGEPNGFADVMNDDSYKKLKSVLSTQYAGVFTSAEIDKIIFDRLTK